MSEALLTFQSQLSGVMETVFQAAMFEITRLVEDSFLEEVSRSREQVESLKKQLQWSETIRKDRDRGRKNRCAECGKLSQAEAENNTAIQSGKSEERGLKQEKSSGGKWDSCGNGGGDTSSTEIEAKVTHCAGTTPEAADREKSKLKEEVLHPPPDGEDLHAEWVMGTDGVEGSDESGHGVTFSEQGWGSSLAPDVEPDPEGEVEASQPLPYRTHYHMEEVLSGLEPSAFENHELDMGEMDGLASYPHRTDGAVGYGVLVGPFQAELGTGEEGDQRGHSDEPLGTKRGNQGDGMESPSGSLHSNPNAAELNCLLINEQGYLQDTGTLYQPQGGDAAAGQRGPGGDVSGRVPSSDSADFLYGGEALTHPLNNGLRNKDERLHSCTQCMFSFPDKTSLKEHMLSHRSGFDSSVFSCNQCGKTFSQACNLKRHQRIHQDDGLHLCSHCGKGFSAFSDLKRHRCSHAVDKPYCCTLCGNRFSRLWNLKLHRRIHTQEKPHCCPMCDKSFTRADILKVHLRTHTGERPYCCTLCGLSFKRLDHLKSHQRKQGHELKS